MKPSLLVLTALGASLLAADLSAQCVTQPSCSSLGFTKTSTSGCIGTATKCPFESKYNCITQSDLSEYSKNSSNWWYKDKATGLIFQGGKVNVTSNGDQTVYYNKSLTYAPMTLVVTPYNQPTSSTGDLNYVASVVGVTSSSFQIRYMDTDRSERRKGYVSWFAIGY